MLTWIFFDIGSTLSDESECVRARVGRTLARLAGTAQSTTAEAFYAKLTAAVGAGAAHPYLHVMREFYPVLSPEPWAIEHEFLYPGVPELLEHLSQKYHLGCIANQSAGLCDRLRTWNIARYFEVVAASAEVGAEKPDPKIFAFALKKAGCAPQNAVMVGDRLDNDVAPAKALGMRTVWLKQGWGGMVESISEACQPDWIAESLVDLYKIFS